MWQQHLGISFHFDSFILACTLPFTLSCFFSCVSLTFSHRKMVFPVVICVCSVESMFAFPYFIHADTTNGINMWRKLPSIYAFHLKLWKIDIFFFIFRRDPVHIDCNERWATTKKKKIEQIRMIASETDVYIWNMSIDKDG